MGHYKYKFDLLEQTIVHGGGESPDFSEAETKVTEEQRVADCCESTLDGELVPVIERGSPDLGKRELILAICKSGN